MNELLSHRIKLFNEYYLAYKNPDNNSGIYAGITPWQFWGLIVRNYLFDELKVIKDGFAGKRVLIVCAGMSFEAMQFIEGGAQVVCADIVNPPLTDDVRKNVTYCLCDVNNLCFAENSFDIVYNQFSLSLTDKEPHMQQVYKILKPGGYFISVEPMLNTPYYYFLRFTDPENVTDYPDWEEFRKIGSGFDEIVTLEGYFVLLPIFYLFRYLGFSNAIKKLLYFEKKVLPKYFEKFAMLGGVVFKKT
ncbi:MAG: class I SAM-dependent methyltransferase [Magnetococcales bacterium]|nr:class I SAM-dependent methyltransferase [Magnetococcales bacterium]